MDLEKLPRVNIPLPKDPLEQIERFVVDLVEGSLNRLWSPRLNYHDGRKRVKSDGSTYQKWMVGIPQEDITFYVDNVWLKQDVDEPEISVLYSLGYLGVEERVKHDHLRSTLTEKAFALWNSKPPFGIFISYARASSSTLAMLLWSELQREGYRPFLDIRDISKGDIWEKVIKEQVEKNPVFIAILHPKALKSPHVHNEIKWALEAKNLIIPVLHGNISDEILSETGDPFSELTKIDYIHVKNENSLELLENIERLKITLKSGNLNYLLSSNKKLHNRDENNDN